MPLVQRTEAPTVRLCDVIVYWGGQSGLNVTFPLNPAFAQVACALLLRSPMRLTTLHVGGVGVGLGVGRGVGRGVDAGGTTAFGVGVTVGPGDSCGLATGGSEAGTVGDASGDATTTTTGAEVGDGASVTPATV